MYPRAERTRDPELADAFYHVATERGIRKVAEAYLEKRPQAKGRWEEFVTTSQDVALSRGAEDVLAHG